MGKTLTGSRYARPVFILLLPVLLAAVPACREKIPETPASPFEPLAPEDLPDLTFPALISGDDRRYLGLDREGDFQLTELGADVLLLEFLNVHCRACQRLAPILEDAYREIEESPKLRGRVRFLAVAAGNNAMETLSFKKEYKVPFPVIPDPFFIAYNKVGSPGGLPLLLIVTLHPQGEAHYAAKARVGLVGSAEFLVKEAADALTARADDTLARVGRLQLGEWRNLKFNVSDDYLFKLLRESAAGIGLTIGGIESVEVAENDTVYRLQAADGRRVWAKVAGRAKICNICHDIFFIILFDDSGKVLNYTSITVTKGNNVAWSSEDDDVMRKKLVGRSLTGGNPFNPEADSVTSATMSASLIFDTLRRMGETYQAMAVKGLVGNQKSAVSLSGR